MSEVDNEKCLILFTGFRSVETSEARLLTINDRLRTAFLDDLLYLSKINTLNDIDKIENILNPTSSQQVKSLLNGFWN
jgi:5'-deoxynucleotidase YfbR-like HD superfamily hydrolase